MTASPVHAGGFWSAVGSGASLSAADAAGAALGTAVEVDLADRRGRSVVVGRPDGPNDLDYGLGYFFGSRLSPLPFRGPSYLRTM